MKPIVKSILVYVLRFLLGIFEKIGDSSEEQKQKTIAKTLHQSLKFYNGKKFRVHDGMYKPIE
nr:hypothetical protein OIUHVQDI_OIUHVQDI_CDS_0006 [Microvirus sp.]